VYFFFRCILRNKQPEPSGKEGLADVRVIRALYESLDKQEAGAVSGFESSKTARLLFIQGLVQRSEFTRTSAKPSLPTVFRLFVPEDTIGEVHQFGPDWSDLAKSRS